MKARTVVVGLSLSASLAVATPAHALHVAAGTTCGMATTDAPGPPSPQNGTVVGGPVVGTTVAPTITVTCTIQVGALGAWHLGPASVTVAAAGTQVAVLPPTLVSYVAPPAGPVFLCTMWTVNGVNFYYDAILNVWALVPVAIPCAPALGTPLLGTTTYTVLPAPTTI